METVVARKMWRTLEVYHGAIYFVREATDAFAALGARDRMTGYFASRAAPMGAVGAEVVVATFFNFHPSLVHSAIPAAWSLAEPTRWLEARSSAADAYLRRIVGDDITSPEMEQASTLAKAAALACTPEGRPLYAGHASLPWPDQPHLTLWHAITCLREYRGDGHIAAMTAEGLDGCEALVTHAAAGEMPRETLQRSRRWSDAEWQAAETRLRERGWTDGDGALTDLGRQRREHIEAKTDELALRPWEALDESDCSLLRRLVRPWSKAIAASGELVFD